MYCVSDSAFLCGNCDASVHQANFLVARHFRRTICCKCKEFDGELVCGPKLKSSRPICRSCSSQSVHNISDSESSSTSSTSTCISTAIHPKKVCSSSSMSDISVETSVSPKNQRKIVEVKAEDILVNWCRRLGLKNNNSAVTLALQAFSICLGTSLPFRVSLASSLWWSMNMNENVSVPRSRDLQKVEKVSGVPGRVIAVAEKRISSLVKTNRRPKFDLNEGWAECSE